MGSRYTPFTILLWIIGHVVVILGLGYLSYFWSLDQTYIFTQVITGPLSIAARALAWLFQVGPQVMFSIAANAERKGQRPLAKWLRVGGWALNIVDAYTNVVVYMEDSPGWVKSSEEGGASARFTTLAHPLGYLVVIGITWGEELMALVAAHMIILWTEYKEGTGATVSKRLKGLAGALKESSGFGQQQRGNGNGNNNNKSKSKPQQQQGNRGQQQQGHNNRRPPPPPSVAEALELADAIRELQDEQ